jgi:predicted enzyme related to lactoylglutathione lyase
MKVQYLEIVTPDVDAVCSLYSKIHGVSFSEPDQNVGGARTAGLEDNVTLGVRSPMHAGEHPVVRPYIVVEDIEVAVRHAEQTGAQIIVPPMPIPGKGMCAIVYQGGIELGLWQL